MYCSNCGAEVSDGSSFCQSCGKNVSDRRGIVAGEVSQYGQPFARYVAILGGILIIIGSLLPWAKATTVLGSVSKSGVDDGGDGIITLILRVLVVIFALYHLTRPGSRAIGAFICAVLAMLVGIVDYVDIKNDIDDVSSVFASGSVGEGLYVVMIGAGVGLAGIVRNPGSQATPAISKSARFRESTHGSRYACPNCGEMVAHDCEICPNCQRLLTRNE